MTFVTVGEFAIRPSCILAMGINEENKTVTAYCINDQKFTMHYRTLEETRTEYQKILQYLQENA